MTGMSCTDLFMFYIRSSSRLHATRKKEYIFLLRSWLHCLCQCIEYASSYRMLPDGRMDRNPQRLIIFREQTPASEGKGGKQSYATVSRVLCVFARREQSCKKETKRVEKKNCKCSKTQNQTTPNKAAHVLFLTKKRRTCLSGVLIQLKINTGNEAASLSKRAAFLPLSLYVAGRRQYRLRCQDAAQTLEGFFFWPKPLQACASCPCSWSMRPCQPKTRIIAG